MPWRITTGTGGNEVQTDLEYDAFERRIAKRNASETTLYAGDIYEHVTMATEAEHRYKVFAGDQLVAQVVKTEVGNVVTDEVTTYVHDDHLGSSSTTTDEAGAVVETRRFGPFGDTTTDFTGTTVRSGFTGHEHDGELGLINMRGRLYDATTGQFLQADPFVSTLNPRGLNRYAYVMNNPLMNTDPSGFFFSFISAFFGGGTAPRPDDHRRDDDKEPGETDLPTNAAEAVPVLVESDDGAPVDLTGTMAPLEGGVSAPRPGGGTNPDPGMGPSLGMNGPASWGQPRVPGYWTPANLPQPQSLPFSGPTPGLVRGNLLGAPPAAAAAAATVACASNPACAIPVIVGAWVILKATPALQKAVGALINDVSASLASDESSEKGKRSTPDQEAVVELAQEAAKTGITSAEADALLDLAKQAGVPFHDDRDSDHWVGGPHIRVGPERHIRVRP
jgi:RHS repeat-associated protein